MRSDLQRLRRDTCSALGERAPSSAAVRRRPTTPFWRKDGINIVLANYQGRDLFHLLVDLHGDKAAWKLVDQHPEWVREVSIDRPYPRDVNTWEDYQAILS